MVAGIIAAIFSLVATLGAWFLGKKHERSAQDKRLLEAENAIQRHEATIEVRRAMEQEAIRERVVEFLAHPPTARDANDILKATKDAGLGK